MNENSHDVYLTAYQVCKLLELRGVSRRPQMIYNYVKNNLIPSYEVNGQRLILTSDAITWCEKFATKHLVEG